MAAPAKETYGRLSVYFPGKPTDASRIVSRLHDAPVVGGKGRGGIRVIRDGDKVIASRKYLHGGLLRAITGDIFFSEGRALKELAVTRFLVEKGFPVVEPFAVAVEQGTIKKHLYFLTRFEEGAMDLLDFLNQAGPRARLKMIGRLARCLFSLGKLGVFHPDLHLNNILITREGEMRFLDFDKARLGRLDRDDMTRMFWRLDRFAEKMARKGHVTVSPKEKIFFLRVYGRLSGYDMVAEMKKEEKQKRASYRIGWFLDKLLYGRGK